MTINLQKPDFTESKPRITVFGVGGGGGNAVNNMIETGLRGVEFVVANTDSQALSQSKAERVVQLGAHVTEGLGAGANPEVGAAAAEECVDELNDHLDGTHMCFITAGMGGGTGTGAAPVVARAARERGILTVGVVTKPFHFEGSRRMRMAQEGIDRLTEAVDTLIVIPNQNLFRVANDKTTFTDAFAMADQVLYSGVASITDLMVKQGLVNLDFADVRSVMRDMGRAMMGTGEASGEGRALAAAEAAIANPLLDESSMRGARGLLISITGGPDMTLFELDEATNRIREEVDEDANIIMGSTLDDELDGNIRVSVVATGIESLGVEQVSSPRTSASRPTSRPAPSAPQVAPHAGQSSAEAGPAQAPQHEAPQPGRSAYAAEPRVVAAPSSYAAVASARAAVSAPSLSAELEGAVEEAMSDSPSMPSPEDFPAPARATMRAAHGYPHSAHEERTPMGLLKRLTTGMAKREDDSHERAEPKGGAQGEAERSQALRAVETVEPIAVQPARAAGHAPASPRVTSGASSGTTDAYGRQSASGGRPSHEDELEIPAFLRLGTR